MSSNESGVRVSNVEKKKSLKPRLSNIKSENREQLYDRLVPHTDRVLRHELTITQA